MTLMSDIDTTPDLVVRCPICDALIPLDEHWINCPCAPEEGEE